MKLIAGISDEDKRMNAYSEMYSRCEEFCNLGADLYESSEIYAYLKEPLKALGRTLSETAPKDLLDEIKNKVAAGIKAEYRIIMCDSQRLIDSFKHPEF